MKFRALNFDYHADAVYRVLDDYESNRPLQGRSIVRLLPVVTTTNTDKAAAPVAPTEEKIKTSSSVLPTADFCSSASMHDETNRNDYNDNDDDCRGYQDEVMQNDQEFFVEDGMEDIDEEQPNEVHQANVVQDTANNGINVLDLGIESFSFEAPFDYQDEEEGSASDYNFQVDDDDNEILVHSNNGTAKKKSNKRRMIDDSDDDGGDDDDMMESLLRQLREQQPQQPQQQPSLQQPVPPPHHHHQQQQQEQEQQQKNQPVPRHRHQQQLLQYSDTKEMQMQWKQIMRSLMVATGRKRITDKPWHDILLTQERSRHRFVSPSFGHQRVLQGQMPVLLVPPLHDALASSAQASRLFQVEQHLGRALHPRRCNSNLSAVLQPTATAKKYGSFSFSMLETLLSPVRGGRFAPLSGSFSWATKRTIRANHQPSVEFQQQSSSWAIVPYRCVDKRKAENDADLETGGRESSPAVQQQQAPDPSPLPQQWQFALQLAMAALYHNVQPTTALPAESSLSSSGSLPPVVSTSTGRQGTETNTPTVMLASNIAFARPPQSNTAIPEKMVRQQHDDVKTNCPRKIQKTDHPNSSHLEQDRTTATSLPTTTTQHQDSITEFSPPNRQQPHHRPRSSATGYAKPCADTTDQETNIGYDTVDRPETPQQDRPEQEPAMTTTGDAEMEFTDRGGQQQAGSSKSSSTGGCTSFQIYCKASKDPEIRNDPAAKPLDETDGIDASNEFQDDANHQDIPNENNGIAELLEEQVSDERDICWDGPANNSRVSFSDFVQYAQNNRPLEQDVGAIQMDATLSTIPNVPPAVKNGMENQSKQPEGSVGTKQKERSHQQRDETSSERKERKRIKKEKRRLKNERKLERGRSRERSGDGLKRTHKRRRLSHPKASEQGPPEAAAAPQPPPASSGPHQPSKQKHQPALVPTQSDTDKNKNKQNHQRDSSKQPPPELSAESVNSTTETKNMGQADGLDVYARWTNVDDQLQRARKSLMTKPSDDMTTHNAAIVPRGLVTEKNSATLHHGASLKAPPPTVQPIVRDSALGPGQHSQPIPLVPWTAAEEVRDSVLGTGQQSQPIPLVPWTAAASRSKVVPRNGQPNAAQPTDKESGATDKPIGQPGIPCRKEPPMYSQQHPAQATQENPQSVAEKPRLQIDGSRPQPIPLTQFSNEHQIQHRQNEQGQSSTGPQNSVASTLAPHGAFNNLQNTSAKTTIAIDQPSLGRRPTVYHLLEPVKVLCSEKFLETWGGVVGDLASGNWARPLVTGEVPGSALDEFNLGRRIELIDTPLVDHCSVDMELPNRCGILLYNLSELEGDRARSIVLDLAKIAAIGRYENLFVFLCHDTAPTSTTVRHVLQLQTAVIRQDDVAPTSTLFKTVSPRSLAAALAETILCQVRGCCENDAILQEDITSDDLLRQRTQFLLSLLPSLCVRGAIQCIQLARHFCSSGMADEENIAFGALFQNPRLRQQIHLASTSEPSGAPEIHKDAMVQLSHVLRA